VGRNSGGVCTIHKSKGDTHGEFMELSAVEKWCGGVRTTAVKVSSNRC